MAFNLPPTVRLNNYLQGIGRIKSISYVEKDYGPAAENRWSITVKIDGEIKGSCTAARMAVAKEAAAQQALHELGVE